MPQMVLVQISPNCKQSQYRRRNAADGCGKQQRLRSQVSAQHIAEDFLGFTHRFREYLRFYPPQIEFTNHQMNLLQELMSVLEF